MQNNNPMKMIWHNDIFINIYLLVVIRQVNPGFCHYLSKISKNDLVINYCAQYFLPIMHINCDKISARQRIIISLKPN